MTEIETGRKETDRNGEFYLLSQSFRSPRGRGGGRGEIAVQR